MSVNKKNNKPQGKSESRTFGRTTPNPPKNTKPSNTKPKK